jgi:putative membrane protein
LRFTRKSWIACRRSERHTGKGILAGLIGGLVGTIVMTQFQNAWSKASEAIKSNSSEQRSQGEQKQQGKQESEDATMKAAGRIARLTGRQLSHEQKQQLGPLVHYSFGTLQGGVYGSVLESAGASGGFLPGLIFGASLFAVADEIAVPALRLSSKPAESPLSSHLYGLASHLVYGVSTEMVRRGVRAAL